MRRSEPDASRAALQRADELGHEARAGQDDHAALRLWLRLLSCTTQVEAAVRQRLRARFGISLARFDYLAQLHRHPQGLKMKELSRRLMVTGANVTGLTEELQREGLVEREVDPGDRRAWRVRLSAAGRRGFEVMAREHEQWVVELFAGLDAAAVRTLHDHLGRLRVDLVQRQGGADKPARTRSTPEETPR